MVSGALASASGAVPGSPASAPRTWASSPDSYISATMSAPPISSPLTKSCGIVGQLDSAESCWRMRGSGRMSTAANGVPTASSAATVRGRSRSAAPRACPS